MNFVLSVIVGVACVFMALVMISFMYELPKQLKRIADYLENEKEKGDKNYD
jgi:cell division protein FtsW (lipid II flippase)